MIHALRTRLSWQSVGALCLLFAINAFRLTRAGWRVEAGKDGEEALSLIQSMHPAWRCWTS